MATLVQSREKDERNGSGFDSHKEGMRGGRISAMFLKLCCCGLEKVDKTKRDKRLQRRSVLPSSNHSSAKSQQEDFFDNISNKGTDKQLELGKNMEENAHNNSTKPALSLHQRRKYQQNINSKINKASRRAENYESEKYILNKVLDEDKIIVIDEGVGHTSDPRVYDSQESERSPMKRSLKKCAPKKKSTEPLPEMIAKSFHSSKNRKGGFDVEEITKINQLFQIMESDNKKEAAKIAQGSLDEAKPLIPVSILKKQKETPKAKQNSETKTKKVKKSRRRKKASIMVRLEDESRTRSDHSTPKSFEMMEKTFDNHSSDILKSQLHLSSKIKDKLSDDLEITSSIIRQDSVSNEVSSR